jgi:hypothetical protein
MFLGHYAVALAAKRVAPRASLGFLILGAQFLDLLWPALLLVGVEHVRIAPGLMAANSLDFVHYPISHSLVMVIGWALLIGGAYFAVTRYRRGAVVVGGLVLSHWFLDLPMHRPDLPLWPGSEILLGGGLWNSVPLTLLLEFGLLAGGLAIYLHLTRARDWRGRWGFWPVLLILPLFFLGGTLGPPPPDETSLALGGLLLWLLVPWGWWVDRHRRSAAQLEPRTETAKRVAAVQRR